MSNFFGNKRKFAVVLTVVFLVATLAASAFAYFINDMGLAIPVDAAVSLSQPEETVQPQVEDTQQSQTSEEQPEPELPDEVLHPVVFNIPAEMRGVYISGGTDFMKTPTAKPETVKAEIDSAIASAKKLTMNTIIVDTVYDDKVIYHGIDTTPVFSDTDIMAYIVEKARAQDMFVYAVFDASLYKSSASASLLSIGGGSANLSSGVKEFSEKYKLDAILIDGYINSQEPESYSKYRTMGGAIGFDNFMRQSPAAIVKTFSNTVRSSAPSTQIGLLADAVWQNNTKNESGSATKATFTALGSGNADTKAFVEKGLVDFVAVKNYSSTSDTTVPFKEVTTWWGTLAKQNDIPMYIVHASSKMCTQETGWAASDEIARQVIAAREISGFSGSIFNSLQRMVENPKDSATTLVKYYNKEITPQHILTQLAVTKPEKTTFTTFEPSVTFTGASDPNSKVTINGEDIPTDASGYFTLSKELVAGENKFAITHKEKTISYAITRQIQVLKQASPMDNIVAEGSMSITITAVAYHDATVFATVGNTRVEMAVDDSIESETERDSNFRTFSGEYTTPSATTSVQNLGRINVSATWQGQTESISAASIKVNKKAKMEDGVPVVVVASQAQTYPPDTLNNIPNANYYPIPKGAMDYIVGDEIVYKKNDKTYTYVVLASGLRVESKDVQTTSEYASGNVINALNVTSDQGSTYVTLKTLQKVTYSVQYSGGAISFKFNNTVKTPDSIALDKNPLFRQADWSGGNTLALTLEKSGSFMGYKGYYDESGNLVFKFNNTPSSIANARIAIDPGHGGSDIGASGFLADYPEKTLNTAIAQMLADELQSRGATVKLIDTSSKKEISQRVSEAEQFGADLFVSIHNNTAPRSDATGTEVYYFYPFARTLASSSASHVSGQLETNNRGAKQSYYEVTLSSQVPSVLVECGFMSNRTEYEKLVNSQYQQRIAVGIANSLSATIKSTYTGISGTGIQDTSEETSSNDESSSSSSGGQGGKVTDLTLSEESVTIAAGQTLTLEANISPVDATNPNVTWASSNKAVATVSSGKITAVKDGTATITATTADGTRIKATCKVTVSGVLEDVGEPLSSASDVDFVESEVILGLDRSKKLDIISNTSSIIKGSDFTWRTENAGVATVDAVGNVTAKALGSTSIIATSRQFQLRCTVSVTQSTLKVTAISIPKNSIDIVKDKSQIIEVILTPSTATSQDLIWGSKNTRVAAVDSFGRVTGISAGKTEITAKTTDGKLAVTCVVNVIKNGVDASYIEIWEGSLELPKGQKQSLSAMVYPENATDTELVWSSSRTSIATVDSKGNVTAVRVGTAEITAALKSDTSIKSSITITVVE